MENNNKTIVCWFCGTFIATLLIFVGYLCYSTNTFKESQMKIVNGHIKHIAKVDSIFYDVKTMVLSNDSVYIMNAPALFSQLQKDSALFKREILLSQEEVNNLVALHIDKIDNDYSQIGIWGGLLSVIFLIFGFFAIFKIEETKAEAKNVLEEVKEKGEKATNRIDELQNQASELNTFLSSIKQDGNSFIENKTKEFAALTKDINDVHIKSNKSLDRITNLLEEVEVKNKRYNWSIKTMENQMKQIEGLANMLKDILSKDGKEDSHE